MSALFRCRAAAAAAAASAQLRRRAAPVALGLASGAFLAARQAPLRLDAAPLGSSSSSSSSSSPPPRRAVEPEEEGWLSPEVIKQLSGGSLSGLLTGLVVSVFSKTLVLLMGVAIVAVQVASRYGVDVVDLLKLRQRVQSSKVLSALSRNTSFKLAFGVTFAMSAFMQF